MTTQWRYTDATQTVVVRRLEDGGSVSMLASAVPDGDVILPSVPGGDSVPLVVTRFQARAALHLSGRLMQVEALMAGDGVDMLARLAWTDAQEFRRDSPTVAAMAEAMGLSAAQVDELFVLAAGINA